MKPSEVSGKQVTMRKFFETHQCCGETKTCHEWLQALIQMSWTFWNPWSWTFLKSMKRASILANWWPRNIDGFLVWKIMCAVISSFKNQHFLGFSVSVHGAQAPQGTGIHTAHLDIQCMYTRVHLDRRPEGSQRSSRSWIHVSSSPLARSVLTYV